MKPKKIRTRRFRRYGRWKTWKRPSFQIYFALAATALIVVTAILSAVGSDLIAQWVDLDDRGLVLLMLFGISLIIGWGLSIIIGGLLLKPIAALQEAMNDVTEGNLNVSVKEKNSIEEVENINHSFNIMMRELRSNSEMQKDFVSNVSHEFKTPLNAIEGYATLLQEEGLTYGEREDYAREILTTTHLMSQLVGDILLLSKLENQAIEYKRESFSLDEQIRRAVVLLEPFWSKKQIEVDGEFESVYYYGNPSLLFNVWRNLIENAVKFSPDGGKISLSLKRVGGRIVFAVRDDGPGIKDADKGQIFNKFYQGDTSRRQDGSGLGLALVKKILESQNGTVHFENNNEGGCTFFVTLTEDL